MDIASNDGMNSDNDEKGYMVNLEGEAACKESNDTGEQVAGILSENTRMQKNIITLDMGASSSTAAMPRSSEAVIWRCFLSMEIEGLLTAEYTDEHDKNIQTAQTYI